MSPEEKLKKLLETIVLCIAKHTKSPSVSHRATDTYHVLELSVDPKDQGRLVGKKGSVIWSIQTIFWYAGLTLIRHPCQIKLLEPENPQRNLPSPPFKFNKKWDRQKIQNLAQEIVTSCMPLHASLEFSPIDDTETFVTLRVEAYLQTPISEPSFTEAFDTILHAAGMSNGAKIKTKVIFQ